MSKWEWILCGIVWAALIGAWIYSKHCERQEREFTAKIANATLDAGNKLGHSGQD